MKRKRERNRLKKEFGIKDYSKGVYEEGLFDGLKIAEKKYKKWRDEEIEKIKKKLKEKFKDFGFYRFDNVNFVKIIDEVFNAKDD
jgi:hypothetical protein